MIQIAILCICALSATGQDAVLTAADPFRLSLAESAAYQQSFLVEVDPHQFNPQWAALYAHQATTGRSVVELEFVIVHKQYPEREGRVLGKCRLQDHSRRWCRVDPQGLNLHNNLIKLKLDCVSDCTGNLTIGFARSTWTGQELPPVMGAPLEAPQSPATGGDNFIAFKIIGWMVLTLVLVLLAIQFGQKIANKFDARAQEERMSSLKEKRIPQQKSQQHRKAE